jgi:hypothetical protein
MDRRPVNVPVSWRDAAGHHLLAYARSWVDSRFYSVVNCSQTDSRDVLAVVDDFGDLQPIALTGGANWWDWWAWKPVSPVYVQRGDLELH